MWLVSLLLCGACADTEIAQLSTQQATIDDCATAIEATRTAALPRCTIAGDSPLVPAGVRAASGPIALGQWAGRAVALIANEDEAALHIVDATDMRLLTTQTLPGDPAHLLILPDGRVALTLRHQNRLLLLAPGATPEQGMTQLCSTLAAQEPIALAATAQHLLVASGFGAVLSRFDLASLTLIDQLPLGREPRALMLSQDRRVAWVSHMVGGLVTRIDLQQWSGSELVAKRSRIDEGPSRAVQGFALAAYVDEGGHERIFSPQVSSLDPTKERHVSGYGTTTSASLFVPWVAAIDSAEVEMMGSGSEPTSQWRKLCMLPRAAVVYQNRLFVACLDRGTVVETDARFLDPMTAVYRRYRVAQGPKGLAMDRNGRLFVWSLFDHQLTRIDRSESVARLSNGGPTLTAIPSDRSAVQLPNGNHESTAVASTQLILPRRARSEWTPERLDGRALFHLRDDSRISATGASCESCHPDGRDDGLRWSDGTATLFLAGRLDHGGPFGWHGEHKTLRERVQNTCKRLGGLGFNRKEDQSRLDHLVAYMQARRPPPPPLPQEDIEQAQISRGEAIFNDTLSCAACHPKGGANGSKLRVDGRLRDTPSLHYIAAAAPYFHDNRYASLEEVLDDPTQPMDMTGQLNDVQRTDLAAYVRSLPFGVVTEAPELRADAWRLHPPESAAWRKTGAKAPTPVTLVPQDRLLIGEPIAIDLADIPRITLPYEPDDVLHAGSLWVSGRDDDGSVLVPESRYAMVTAPKDKRERGVVPHFIASHHGAPRLEIQGCRPRGLPVWSADYYNVSCPRETHEYQMVPIDNYGYAVRTQMDNKDTLLLLTPDLFSSYTGGWALVYGDGAISLQAIRLGPGHSGAVMGVRGNDFKWRQSGFAPVPRTMVSVTWPVGARAPQILVAQLTRH